MKKSDDCNIEDENYRKKLWLTYQWGKNYNKFIDKELKNYDKFIGEWSKKGMGTTIERGESWKDMKRNQEDLFDDVRFARIMQEKQNEDWRKYETWRKRNLSKEDRRREVEIAMEKINWDSR